ncbi:MAG: polyphosphate kinase 1, partial [Bryobacteraceae bacterium]
MASPGRPESRRRSRKNGLAPTPAPLPSPPPVTNPPADPKLFNNRELSLLDFQQRVLDEAQDPRNPLLERVKFLSIVGSNLDEFFMVRVAAIKEQIAARIAEVGPDGLSPATQLEAIRENATRLMEDARTCFRDQLRPALAEAGIEVLNYADLQERQREKVDAYFRDSIFPVLTPLAFDPGRPFPHISNLSLNLAVLIRDHDGAERFARIKVPDTIPQLMPASNGGRAKQGQYSFVWVEQVIAANLPALFPGMEIVEAHPFHVARDADTEIRELEAGDLLETVEEGLRQRRFADVVRLMVTKDMPEPILEILVSNLEVDPVDVYRVADPLAISRLRHLGSVERADLKYPPFVPVTAPALEIKKEEDDIFSNIRRGDILMHHPFESFQSVVDFLQRAARDPNVLAIKMTLYRVGRNSPIVEALLEAMEKGKQVAVLVELKARFDEESNIEWARALEREGVHVVYGLLGLKIHAKATLVVRREGARIRRYVHLATGNYNAVTAHLYTDVGYFTTNEDVAADVTDLFNYLTGYSAKDNYRKLLVAPINLRRRLRELVQREIDHQQQGGQGKLILKMNALVDPEMIRLLYAASRAGVKVDLLIRGVCCLRPQLPGVSENIRVISI